MEVEDWYKKDNEYFWFPGNADLSSQGFEHVGDDDYQLPEGAVWNGGSNPQVVVTPTRTSIKFDNNGGDGNNGNGGGNGGVGGNSGGGSGGARLPDFYSLNVTFAIPNPFTGTFVGWSGNATIDRHGQIYISPFGVSVGKSTLLGSASITANWLSKSNKPSATETYNFLSGHE